MKKFFLILTMVVSSFLFFSFETANSSAASAAQQGPRVPEAVLVTFNQEITNIFDTYFPGNSGWDDSNLNWEKDKNDWRPSGFISLNGGTGQGVQVIDGLYSNQGNLDYMYYEVHY